MKKYTAKDIVEQFICFENLTKGQFNKLKKHFQKLYPNQDYTSYDFREGDWSFRFYYDKYGNSVLGSLTDESHCSSSGGVKASLSITFDEFNFEEQSQYPKVMWVWQWNGEGSPSGQKRKRVVHMEAKGLYYAWKDAETIEDAEQVFDLESWDYAQDIVEPEQFTKADIAKLLNKDINSFEII